MAVSGNSLFFKDSIPMNLKNANKKEREVAVKNAEAQIRALMQNDPSISKDKLVSITGFSEYTLNELYMKVRRENIKKAV